MFGFIDARPKARSIYAAVLISSLCACKTGGGGGVGNNNLNAVLECVSNLTGPLAELPILSAAALDNLPSDQLDIVTNSLGSLTGLALSSVGELLNAVDAGEITGVLAGCRLEEALAAAGITNAVQLPAGPLTDLLALLPLDLVNLLDLNNILASLGQLGPNSLGDLLTGLQGGSILPADLPELFLQGLASAGLPGPLQSVADTVAPGLALVLDQLSAGLPGGLSDLPAADLLALVNGVSAFNSQGSTDPLATVLSGVTGVLSVDAASALTDAVLGALIGGAPDVFANGLSDVLAQLDGGLPGGLDSLPPANILDLANAINIADQADSLTPVSAVLATITNGLSGDAATVVTDAVLDSLGSLRG